MTGRGPALTALSIVPDRELASQFTASNDHSRSFQIVAELKAYPTNQALEVRLRQVKPDVILLDLATDLDAACELIRNVTLLNQQTHIVGLHLPNDTNAILLSLRAGASEFPHAPFYAHVPIERL